MDLFYWYIFETNLLNKIQFNNLVVIVLDMWLCSWNNFEESKFYKIKKRKILLS